MVRSPSKRPAPPNTSVRHVRSTLFESTHLTLWRGPFSFPTPGRADRFVSDEEVGKAGFDPSTHCAWLGQPREGVLLCGNRINLCYDAIHFCEAEGGESEEEVCACLLDCLWQMKSPPPLLVFWRLEGRGTTNRTRRVWDEVVDAYQATRLSSPSLPQGHSLAFLKIPPRSELANMRRRWLRLTRERLPS